MSRDGKTARSSISADRVRVLARWMPDGESILFLSESTGGGAQDHRSLGIYHLPSARLRWLIDDRQSILESAWPTPDGMLIVDEIVASTHKPSLLDPYSGKETPFPSLPGNLHPAGSLPHGDWVARLLFCRPAG